MDGNGKEDCVFFECVELLKTVGESRESSVDDCPEMDFDDVNFLVFRRNRAAYEDMLHSFVHTGGVHLMRKRNRMKMSNRIRFKALEWDERVKHHHSAFHSNEKHFECRN